MDGLLGNQNALSLLGMSPENIARSRDQAQSDMYFALAGSLLGGGPTGLSIAKGLQAGQQAYRNALKEQQAEQMQLLQLQEFKRKKDEEEAANQRKLLAQQILFKGYVPGQNAVEAPTPTGPISGAAFGEVPQPAVPASYDISKVAPLLMSGAAGQEGIDALLKQLNLQKAMAGETATLAEGAKLVRTNPITGKVETIATGTEKPKALKEVDIGSHIVMLDPQTGVEVGRIPKGRAPEGPVALQHVETEQGIATFNPRTGQLTPIMQGGKPIMGKGAGNLTESQGNATTFGMRMAEANKTLTSLENAGLKDTGMLRSGISGTVGAVPLIGESMSKGVDNVFNVLPSIMGGLNEAQQSTLQARVNFITAVLRKESGASISPSEFATAEKNYFPAPGDSEKIIAQKQKAREMAIKGMKLQAGPGAKYIGQETGVTSSGW